MEFAERNDHMTIILAKGTEILDIVKLLESKREKAFFYQRKLIDEIISDLVYISNKKDSNIYITKGTPEEEFEEEINKRELELTLSQRGLIILVNPSGKKIIMPDRVEEESLFLFKDKFYINSSCDRCDKEIYRYDIKQCDKCKLYFCKACLPHFCGVCLHKKTHVVEGNFKPHKAKRMCSDCSKFVCWVSIKTLEEVKEQKKKFWKKLNKEFEEYLKSIE